MSIKVKNIKYFISILLAVLTLSNGLSYGQNYDDERPYDEDGMELPPDSLDQKGKGKDDKKNREKKPFESYYFNDTIKLSNIFSWNRSTQNNNVELRVVDTLLGDFHRDYIFMREETMGSAYLGNLGAATVPLDYFNRVSSYNFSFLDAYQQYTMTPEEINFYNTKRAFTQLSFFTSGQISKAEEQLRITHVQNISPSTSFNIEYRNNATRGLYADQQSKDKNFSFAVNHTGSRYNIHSGYVYNMGDIQENGGLTSDFYVTDTLIDLTANIPMNLGDAYNNFKGNTFYVTQSYGVPLSSIKKKRIERLMALKDSLNTDVTVSRADIDKVAAEEVEYSLRDVSAVFIGQHFEITSYKNIYSDLYASTEDGYYDNWYINPTYSSDSIREQKMDARFFIQLQPYDREGVIGTIDGGLGYVNENYYYFEPSNYVFNSSNTVQNSLYVYSNAQGKFKQYINWDGHFEYYPIGHRSQDVSASGNINLTAFVKERPVTISAGLSYRLESPSFWSENYYSNHFKWQNSFEKEGETRLEAKLTMANYGIEMGIKQSVITNEIYYDADALPAQYDDVLSVSSVYLQKDFRIGGLNLKNRVLLQWSSSQIVAPVPLVTANALYYYEFDVTRNVLRMQIGVDAYYNTSYYGFGYNPATMQFYNQRTTQTGNYLWVDGYVSGKWKRLRFLVKMQHLNYELFDNRNYFQVAHYPLNRRMIKTGVSWNFYD